MNELVSPQTLYRYFEKKATRHEKQLIAEWLRHEGNEEIFYQHLAVWESSNLQFSADTDTAMKTFEQVLQGGERPEVKLADKETIALFPIIKITAVAACFVLVIASVLYSNRDYFLFNTFSTDFGMTKNIVLEDGTEVTLNANSKLKVPKQFSGDREVWLEGEAFFSVTKKLDKSRFFVHTENLNVEVLGTEFNVNTRHDNTEVVLNEGSIKLTSNLAVDVKPLMMQPGDLVSLSKTDSEFHKKTVKPESHSSWQTNLLIFEDAPLTQVAQKIEDYYGVDVELASPELEKRMLTGTMPNNDLGIVLKSLGASLKIEIVRENNKIIFK